MALITPEDWRPVDIEDLEPNAWTALRHKGSTLVVAGPGAGKTEFLAQRAAYLLQTGICPAPKRVLAISFKRDAAENLVRRVRTRCTEDQTRRFVSVTFDAFTKGLVDRFSEALPASWPLARPYEVYFPKRDEVEEFFTTTRLNAPFEWKASVGALRVSDFEARVVGGHRLPPGGMQPTDGNEFALDQWWQTRLRGPRSTLTFSCLNRLAELLARTNPQLRRALLLTYPFVFVDEFQDTTYAQYDFLVSLFGGSSTQVTAVGDDKQRIMAWAGARQDAFAQLEADFGARRVPLTLNHRSSPGLVRIQQVVAEAIDAGAAEVESRAESAIDGEVAEIWNFATGDTEAEAIADWLRADMENRGTTPRDYAILVRQRADRFQEQLRVSFARQQIGIRNESEALGRTTLQDLLSEEVTRVALAVLRLSAAQRSPGSWATASEAVMILRAVDPDDERAAQKAVEALSRFVRQTRIAMTDAPTSERANALVDSLYEFLDPRALRQAYTEYATGEALQIAIEAFGLHLAANADDAPSWTSALDQFEGADSTPLMTVHKSKGLEYDTILFIGLDDNSWWSHRAGDIEGLSTFFVALSRARQRAIFTYCRQRRRDQVADIYQLLRNAGVPEVMH